MRRPYRQIPEWYAKDWTPAQGRGELPQMSWSDLEAMVPRLLAANAQQDRAQSLLRGLWLQSANLAPMALLQALLWISAQAFSPTRCVRDPTQIVPNPACGPLPRWSYTDVEVALSYTWRGQALLIANERHRDLLAFRGEDCLGQDSARRLILLVSGLPSSPMPTEKQKAPAPTDFSVAA